MQMITAELKLMERIGGGGFGTVWKGRRISGGIEQDVAIKILKTDVAEHLEFVHRLRDEARLLARLTHRAIVKMVDFTDVDGMPAVIMEYVEGVDMKDLIKGGPIPLRPLLQIGVETASALTEAHRATDARTGQLLKLIHRDIKPENLRITPRGEVKVLDFGIAKATFEEREAKSGSLFIGSKGYIPPERILMQEGQGVDVFALGVVLAEGYSGKATGQCPIDPTNIQEWKENYQVWQQLVLGRLSGAPKVFVQLIQQMLAFDAKNRPSMDIVEDRLEELSRQASGPRLKDWIADVLKKDAPRSTPAETLTRETLLNVDTALVPAKKRPYQTETVLLGAAGLGLLLVSSLVCTSGLAIRFFWPESVRVSTEQAAPAPTAAPVVSATQSETPPPISIDDTPAVPEAATPVIKATPTPARTPTPVSKATPTPKATPVPAATPTLKATPTPAVSTGSIVVEGAQGRLKGGGSLDSVVPGSVTIIVSFPSGATREFPMNVYAGQTITLRCDPAMENCSR